MSARDDADSSVQPARAPRAGWRLVAAALLGAAFGAVLAGALAQRLAPDRYPRYEAEVHWRGGPPEPREWPRPARAGERAMVLARDGREWLVVRAPTAPTAVGLAQALQRRRLSGVDASSARRAVARAQWRAAATEGSSPLSPAGQCAALVRGRLLLVALADQQAGALAPPPSPGSAEPWARLEAAEGEVVRLALAARPDSLAPALTACAAAEGEWLGALARELRGGALAQLESAWLWHERSQAPVLDGVERELEVALSEAEGAAVVSAAFAHALALERLAPDPAALLFVHGAWGDTPRAAPVVPTWIGIFGLGALVGGLAGLSVAAGLGRLLRRREPRERSERRARSRPPAAAVARSPRPAWDAELGWLHLISGPDRERIAHAAGMLADSFLQRGHRVLLVDAGRTLRLHERFGGDTRWGLGECLAGRIPLLGAVQAAGRPGCLFLAHGDPAAAGRWEDLSALLEAAREHFGRVILALDPRTPPVAALPLGGRVLEAWWAESGPALPRAAASLSDRLAIPFACLNLDWLTRVMREAPKEPESTALAPRGTGAEAAPAAEVALVGSAAAEACTAAAEEALAGSAAVEACTAAAGAPAEAHAPPAAVTTAAPVAAPPLVLGCDAEMRERLRFLIWMRRMRAESALSTPPSGAGG